VAVADILADLRLDADTLVAAILHDVIEDTPTAKAEIASIFGQVVAELVDGVSKLDQIQFKNRQEAQAESFRKMLLAMVRDIRVIMVKLADRMHNMRTLGVMPPVKRRRSARETLEIYAPIAERLGLYAVKLELEDLGFRALYPYRYKVLERELKRARGNQKEFIGKIAETFKGHFEKFGEIVGEVEGREKHLYSIYKKMQNKGISLNEMVDVYGFRIIVDSRRHLLPHAGSGAHAFYKPMPGRFKDYIAIPRVNGYQSLHTTLFGPNGVPIEVQIRSEQMHRVAESGIAAHWKYKSGGDSSAASNTIARASGWRAWCRSKRAAAPRNSSRASRSICSPTRCTCSRPKGRSCACRPVPPRWISPMPSTPMWAIAASPPRSIGAWCRCARPLRNGQTVEIITAKGATPNPSWSTFVVTAKARAAIGNLPEESQARRGAGARPAPAGPGLELSSRSLEKRFRRRASMQWSRSSA
jgi:guanosine-3',5'-bis(diphosphate) 3'-pyrophosphohydrolase